MNKQDLTFIQDGNRITINMKQGKVYRNKHLLGILEKTYTNKYFYLNEQGKRVYFTKQVQNKINKKCSNNIYNKHILCFL